MTLYDTKLDMDFSANNKLNDAFQENNSKLMYNNWNLTMINYKEVKGKNSVTHRNPDNISACPAQWIVSHNNLKRVLYLGKTRCLQQVEK